MRTFAYDYRKFIVGAGLLFTAMTVTQGCEGGSPEGLGAATETKTSALTGSLTVSGVVSDTSGVPVFNAIVALNGGAQASVRTDFMGKYSFSVNPGSYSLSVSNVCASYQPNVVNLNGLTASTQVNFVGSGGECNAFTFSGGTSGSLTLSGHVTSSGHAVPGAKVTLAGSTSGFRYTDQTGAYSFFVNPGSYSLQVSGGCASFSPNVANLNGLTASRVQDFQGSGNCPIAPLALCPLMDLNFLGESQGSACDLVSSPDCTVNRVDTWSNTFTLDYAIAVSGDCRFGQWASLLNSSDVATWLNDLLAFNLYFFGCPATGTVTAPLSFSGLIPEALASRTFTTADLGALSATFSAAIAQGLSDNGSPPLTAAQAASVNAQLAALAAAYPNKVTSSTFTFSTCP
jgi:hypothetical protein